MKHTLKSVLRWLASPRARGELADAGPVSPIPEHERRLREMEKSGRILFLP